MKRIFTNTFSHGNIHLFINTVFSIRNIENNNIKKIEIMKAQNVRRFLDNRYRRVTQYSSANWGGNNVWNVASDGQTEGRFIFEDDDNNFILLDRTEENEETQIEDLFIYTIGSGEIKNLLV